MAAWLSQAELGGRDQDRGASNARCVPLPLWPAALPGSVIQKGCHLLGLLGQITTNRVAQKNRSVFSPSSGDQKPEIKGSAGPGSFSSLSPPPPHPRRVL